MNSGIEQSAILGRQHLGALMSQNLTASPATRAATEVFCKLDYHSLRGRTAHISCRAGVRFDAIGVYRYQSRDLRSAVRRSSHIHQDAMDDFVILAPLLVPITVSQCNLATRIAPGSFVVLTTAKPFEATPDEHPSGLYSELAVHVSGSLLRQQVPHIDACCNRPVPIRSGAGRIMHTLFDIVLLEGPSVGRDGGNRLGAMLVDAIAAAALEAPELRDAKHGSYRSAHERVRAVATDYIRLRLADPELDAAAVANRCNVSIRYLHAAFAAASTTVGGVIRELRLQQCRAELISTSTRPRSITQLAMKWGFNSASSFSRTYRERFGKSPREEVFAAVDDRDA